MEARVWPASSRVYDFVKQVNAASLQRNWRVEGDGLERLAGVRHGLIAANHGHLVDGTVIMPLVRERVLFLCDARAVDSPLLGHLLRAMGVLRVDVTRPDPRGALAALRAAASGHVLGIFPEGRVDGGRGLLPARPGVAHLAASLGQPVLPVALWGLEAFNRPLDVYVRRILPVIHVRVGVQHGVCVPRRDAATLRAAADAIMVLIARMLPPELHGVYRAGCERRERGERALQAAWVRPMGSPPSGPAE